MNHALWMFLGASIVMLGCGHGRIVPAAAAAKVAGAPTAAIARENGLRISANGGAWHGDPKDLTDRVTPIKVQIVNRSGKPVRILYQAFSFKGGSGHIYHPRPVIPFDHDPPEDGTGTIKPIYMARNFYVANRFKDVYLCCDAWPHPLPRDERLYRREYRSWNDDPPTRDMKRESLPEGVLDDGGAITGYLYFDNVTDSEKRVLFQARLEDGDEGELVAEMAIPFRVE